MTPHTSFRTSDGVHCGLERCTETGNIYIAAHNQMVTVCINQDGIIVQITKANDVLAECATDSDA